jgi:arsenite-transporting ATPase
VRILLYSGKGGVGKTSVAGATAVHLAESGQRTLIMSVDPAHSLADSFDFESALFHGGTSEPVKVAERLYLQEVNINHEMKRHWADISTYITSLLQTTGLSGVEADEMAILSAMMYVNQYRKSGDFDVIVLDCAPTAESLRFISLPSTLDWYMKHVFGFQRSLLKAARPVLNRLSPVDLPPDSYFKNVQDLFNKIEGIDTVLEDPQLTSVRLVTNAEKMVLRETQRAFVYFTLHGLTVDTIVVNRLLPESVQDTFFSGWRDSQRKTLEEIITYFDPVPTKTVPLFQQEVLGYGRLKFMAEQLYPNGEDPSLVTRDTPPFSFVRTADHYEVRLQMPFAVKGEVSVFKKHDELVIEVGTIRRHIGLPTTMTSLVPVKAQLNERMLVVEMKESA